MSFPPGMLGTFMELYSDEIDDFAGYLSQLTPDELNAAATFNDELIKIQSVLEHVIVAGCYYAHYMRHALRHTTPESEIELKLPPDQIGAVRSLIPRTKDAIEGFWNLTEAELAKLSVATSWNQTYTADQLIEHAIVHIPWHKRQCKRILLRAANRL